MAAGASRVVGIDEVGRGPLAGPVSAAAVRLDPDAIPPGLDDSKRLAPGRREALAAAILARAETGLGHASVAEIDAMGILRASGLAMLRALAALPRVPCLALIDGRFLPAGLDVPGRAIVGGDGRVASIAAASILAKVSRDAIMADLAAAHPGYGWERNAGYPTAEHRAALLRLGPTPAHRRSFAPVARLLQEGRAAPGAARARF